MLTYFCRLPAVQCEGACQNGVTLLLGTSWHSTEPVTKPVCRRVRLVRPLPHATVFLQVSTHWRLSSYHSFHSRCSVRETFTNNNKSWCKIISWKHCLAFPPTLLWQFLLPTSTKKLTRLHLPMCAYLLFFLSFLFALLCQSELLGFMQNGPNAAKFGCLSLWIHVTLS